jgi:flavin-dependent dehydrogenase
VDRSLDIAAAVAREWDVLVIGAGPAGGVAALALARGGARVLLVDRAAFPREKVCGCCLSARGAEMLRDLGVRLPAASGFRGVVVRCGRREAVIDGAGVVIPRRDLDVAITEAAVGAGATFIPACAARAVGASRGGVAAALGGHGVVVRARTVVAADGIGGSALDARAEFRPRVAARSCFGASTVLDAAPAWAERGAVHMTVGEGGYVGAVRLADGRTNLAAAIDPSLARRVGGPSRAAAAILESSGLDAAGVWNARWRGTPALTRSRCVQSGRVFVIGDAAGYVEPFTGEGMTWAIAGALAVAPHVQAAVATRVAVEESWPVEYHRLFGARHRACGVVAALVRSPRLVRALLAAGGVTRALARVVEPRAVPA